MPLFYYLARDQFGVLRDGTIESDGRQAALAELDDAGLFLFEIEEERRKEQRRREERRREERRRDDQGEDEQRKQDQRKYDRRTQDRRMHDRRIQDRSIEERRTVFGPAHPVLTDRDDHDVEEPVLTHG